MVLGILKRHVGRKKGEYFKSLIDSIPNPVFIQDTGGFYLECNKLFEEFTGVSKESIIGHRIYDFISNKELADTFYRLNEDVLGDKSSHKYVWEGVSASGVYKSIVVNKSSLKDKKGTEIGIIGVVTELEIQKKIGEELEEVRSISKEIEGVKTSLISNLNHELRTPLNGILGFTEILMCDEENTDRKEMLELIKDSGERLLRVFNDVVNLSAADSRDPESEAVKFEVRVLLDKVVSGHSLEAVEKGLDFNYHRNGDISDHVIGDALGLYQIMDRLLSNAVKFTEEGSITVTVNSRDNEDKGVIMSISIEDTGIGINEENLDRIFDDLTQGDMSIRKKYDGIGIGLAIVKKLISVMNGRMRVESAPGKGSIFKVSLPFQLEENL